MSGGFHFYLFCCFYGLIRTEDDNANAGVHRRALDRCLALLNIHF